MNRTLTLIAPDGATLDGSQASSRASGIRIPEGSSAAPTIDGFTVRNYVDCLSAESSTGAWTLENATLEGCEVQVRDSTGDWTVGNTTVRGSSTAGVWVSRSTGAWTIRESTITHNDDGIRAYNATGGWEVHETTITDNRGTGLAARGPATNGEATRNWWGDGDGPSGDFSGSGDEAVGNLTVEPFYTDAARTTLSDETATPCVSGRSPGVAVALRPNATTVGVGETTTFDVVADGTDAGVSAYEIEVNSTDTSRARITGASDAIGGTSQNSTASDGSGVRIAAFAGSTADTGPITIATVTVEGVAAGAVDVPLSVVSLSDGTGAQYLVGSATAGADLTVTPQEPDVMGDGNPARDPDGDGLYEDVNGDGDVAPGDATVLFDEIF